MANTFKRKVQASIGTTLTSVGTYTVPASTQVTIIGLTVANTSVSNITVDVTLYNGVTDYYIVKNCPVPIGSSVVIIGGDQKVVLESGDSVRVKQSDAAASADVIMSILEIA